MILWGLRLLLFAILFGDIVSQNINTKVTAKEVKDGDARKDDENKQRTSHMDLLIDNVRHQRWEPDDSVCLEKILNVMNNVKSSTLWATWIWDAMQSPVGLLYGSKYQFGNYDQCMDAPWLHTHPEYRTQYCLADIKLADEELEHTYIHPDSHVKNYISSTSKYGLTFNKISLGVCLPVECKTRAVSQFVKVLFEDSHLGNAVPDANITVNPCEFAGAPVEYPTTFYITIIFLILMIVITILCTICNNGKQNTVGSKLINAFCMIKNHTFLSESADDDIKVMHGMRSLSAGIAVFLHVYLLTNWVGSGNALQVEKDMDKLKLTAMSHTELVVDTFLMMSGLLLMKGLMMAKTINPFVLIAKRYLRLVWIIGLFTKVSMYVTLYSGEGPLWKKLARKEVTACELNWWPNFLMLGNYIDTANMCYPILWTVPVDFHLYTTVIIVYWIFTKNRRAGLLTFAILFVASIIMPGYVTYQRKLPATPSFDIKVMVNFRSELFTNPTYIWTHLRAGPYFVGVMAGYFLSIYKPVNHRMAISKITSSIAYTIASIIAIMMLVMGSSCHDKGRLYDVWEAAIFASVNRTVWAVAMACIIMSSEYGTVPLIGSFLSWSPWIPLSKLSYGVYLVHPLVYSCILGSMRFPLKYSIYLVLIYTLAMLVISNILSYILQLFFEAPMAKIFNILFYTKYKKLEMEKNNGIEKNGIHQNGVEKKNL